MDPVLVEGDLGLGQIRVSILGSSRWPVRLGILHGKLAQLVTTVDKLDTLGGIVHTLGKAVVQVRGVALAISSVVRLGTLKVSALLSVSVVLPGFTL